jgi:two-component system KDP operon response regulator KdpE
VARILVIDDDPALRRALRLALQHSGYDVVTAANGEQGMSDAALVAPDVIVLDLGLPDIDGLTVCSRIREWSDVAIIVLSAADSELRKVAALDGGANDYVTKPFGMAELEARIRASLRVHKASSDEPQPDVVVGPLRLDLVHRETRLDGTLVKLTAREFDLLSYLARYAGKVCTHQMILEAVWGSAYSKETPYLHEYMHRLRRKLQGAGDTLIETTPGIGYVLIAEGADGGRPAS